MTPLAIIIRTNATNPGVLRCKMAQQQTLPASATVTNDLRRLHDAYHRTKRKKKPQLAEVNDILDQATQSNWHVQYDEEAIPQNPMAIIAALLFGLFLAWLVIPLILLIIFLAKPTTAKTHAELTIPTQNGALRSSGISYRDKEHGMAQALDQAITQMIERENPVRSTRTRGKNYQGP